MYQYTTEPLVLIISGIEFHNVSKFRVAIRGKYNELIKIIDVTDSEVDADTNTLRIPLTQQETASLGKGLSQVQVRIITTDDEVYASNKERVKVDSVLDEVVV